MEDREWMDIEERVGEPTELETYLSRIDETRDRMQVIVFDHVKTAAEKSTLETACIEHIYALKGLLKHIFSEDAGYETEDAVEMTVSLLMNDDAERVDFLKALTGSEESDEFGYGYMDRESTITGFTQAALHMKEDNDCDHDYPDEYIDELMRMHTSGLQDDINSFLNSSIMKAQVEKTAHQTQQKHDRKERLIQFATTTAAVVAGSLIAKALWPDKGK